MKWKPVSKEDLKWFKSQGFINSILFGLAMIAVMLPISLIIHSHPSYQIQIRTIPERLIYPIYLIPLLLTGILFEEMGIRWGPSLILKKLLKERYRLPFLLLIPAIDAYLHFSNIIKATKFALGGYWFIHYLLSLMLTYWFLKEGLKGSYIAHLTYDSTLLILGAIL